MTTKRHFRVEGCPKQGFKGEMVSEDTIPIGWDGTFNLENAKSSTQSYMTRH